jgi:hypothetical protein
MPLQSYVAGRPLQATQPVKRHPRPRLSAAANADIRAHQREKNTAYNNALDDANKAINDIIENLAVTHKKSIHRVQSTLHMGRDSITNAQRTKSSAWNAFCWKKAKEVRDECPGEIVKQYSKSPTWLLTIVHRTVRQRCAEGDHKLPT